jgi:hypothetical protein
MSKAVDNKPNINQSDKGRSDADAQIVSELVRAAKPTPEKFCRASRELCSIALMQGFGQECRL